MSRFEQDYRSVPFAIAARGVALVVGLMCAGAAAATESPFNGRWRVDQSSVKGDVKPTIFQVVDGGFRRDDNAVVKADGIFHPIPSDGYVDEQSISVESDHVVKEIDKIRGKLAYTVTYSVSPDGNTLTWHVASYTSPSGQAVTSETVQRRVGPAPKGAHLLSGKWERVSVTEDSGSDWILKLDGNHFSSRTDGGGGYDAIIGGKSVKLDGDNSGVRARITRPRPDRIVETDLSARGTVDDAFTMQLMPDGRTIRVTGFYGPDKRRTEFYMRKQVER